MDPQIPHAGGFFFWWGTPLRLAPHFFPRTYYTQDEVLKQTSYAQVLEEEKKEMAAASQDLGERRDRELQDSLRQAREEADMHLAVLEAKGAAEEGLRKQLADLSAQVESFQVGGQPPDQ